jgi:uncharacterized protein YodC (DUF2158 family)
MPDEFKAGDTVKLKSGGPFMTIESISEYNGIKKARCVWFDEKGTRFSELFALATLAPE